MALITTRPTAAPADPLAALRLDECYTASPAAQHARLVGLLEAKAEAHRAAEHLGRWARPLAVATTAVSGVHLWETLAAVRPAQVAALSLPDAVYHGSALALVAVIDFGIIFLSAAGNASAYAGYTQRSRALPLLYAITGGLNFTFLVAHWPAMPAALRAAALPALAVIFPMLLAVLVPALLVALERAAHVLQATRLALGVEVATLRGLVAAEVEYRAEEPQPHTGSPEPRQLADSSREALQPAPMPEVTWARDGGFPAPELALPASPAMPAEAVSKATRAFACPACGAPLATVGEYGAATRWGRCKQCKEG